MSINAAALFVLVLMIALSTVITLPARADSRTIVVPDNYATIQGAINAASDGDTVFVKKGIYSESTLNISKKIVLAGEDTNNTIISNNDNPSWDFTFPPPSPTVAIQISTSTVEVSGFTITNAIVGIGGNGDGIQIIRNIIENDVDLKGNNQVILGNKVMASFRCNGSHNNITENAIMGNNEGLVLEGSNNFVYGNILLDGLYTGRIRVKGNQNIIFKNAITNSSTGVNIDDGSDNVVYENNILNNRGGLTLGKGYRNTFYNNYVANNDVGVSIAEAQSESNYEMFVSYTNDNKLYHNDFINNTYQVGTGYEVYGTDYFDNGKEGNYWSDYTGNDTNHDGIGDTPYVISSNRQDNFPLMFPFDIDNNRVVVPSTAQAQTDSLLPVEVAGATSVAVVVIIATVAVFQRTRRKAGKRAVADELPSG
jgi:nitrous oxidase accessory protein